MLNYVLVTSDKYTAEEVAELHGGIIRTDMVDHLKPYQTIYEVSDAAKNRGLEKGQLVAINIDKPQYCRPVQKKDYDSLKEGMEGYYAKKEYNVPSIIVGDIEYLKLGDTDIEFIIKDYEVIDIVPEKQSKIIHPSKKDIIKSNSKIIENVGYC